MRSRVLTNRLSLCLTAAYSCWCGVAYWYWLNHVPIRPDAEFPREKFGQHVATTEKGELIFNSCLEDSEEPEVGSIRIYDPFLRTLNRQFLGPSDRLLGLSGNGRFAAFANGGEVRVLNLLTGEIAFAAPATDALREAVPSGDGRWLAVDDGGQLTVWDMPSGSQAWSKAMTAEEFGVDVRLWSSAMYRPFHAIVADSILTLSGKEAGARSTVCVSLAGGSILGTTSGEICDVSPDGRSAIVRNDSKWTGGTYTPATMVVYDMPSMTELWSIPFNSVLSRGFHFRWDGQTIQCYTPRKGGAGFEKTELDAFKTDFDPVASLPERPMQHRIISDVGELDRGRLLAVTTFRRAWALPQQLQPLQDWLRGRKWPPDLRLEFQDSSGSQRGFFAPDSFGYPLDLPSRSGFSVDDEESVATFDYSFTRDRIWLVRWCVAFPAVILAILGWLLRQRRTA